MNFAIAKVWIAENGTRVLEIIDKFEKNADADNMLEIYKRKYPDYYFELLETVKRKGFSGCSCK